MNNVRKFESKENRIDARIERFQDEFSSAQDEFDTALNRFDLKLNNGGKITTEDVRSLYKGIFKMEEANTSIKDGLKDKGIEVEDHSLNKLFDEVAKEVDIQARFEKQ